MSHEIAGVLPVAHTPFLDDESIDVDSLQRQIDWSYSQGADGFCTGMVTELLRLTAAERIELTRLLGEINADRGAFVAGVGAELTRLLGEINADRGAFVAGVGAESTRQAIEYAEAARGAGAHAVMAIPPISSRLLERELFDYFDTLVRQVGLPVIVQDASSYVGQEIPHSLCVELLQKHGPELVLFKPEAAPLGPNLSALRDATGGAARIFEGSGGISLIDSFRRGIAGTIPGMEFLSGVIAVWNALQAGDDERAYRIYFPICALVALQLQAGLDGFLAIEKYVLHQRGLFVTPHRRRPFGWELDDETRSEVDRLLAILERELAV